MSVALMMVMFAVGSSAIAFWTDFRFPRLAPSTMKAAVIHVGVSLIVGQLVVPLGMNPLIDGGSQTLALVAVFGIAFPALTYCFLAAVWTIKIAREGLSGLLR